MRTTEAYSYMQKRLQKVCDALGSGDRLRWNNQDAAAIRALLKARSFVYATEEERIEARRRTWRESKKRSYARKKAA